MSRLSRNLEHQDSLSWEDTSQMLYNNSKKGREVGRGRGRRKVEGREGEKEKGFSCRAEVDKLTLDNFIGLYIWDAIKKRVRKEESEKGIEWYSISHTQVVINTPSPLSLLLPAFLPPLQQLPMSLLLTSRSFHQSQRRRSPSTTLVCTAKLTTLNYVSQKTTGAKTRRWGLRCACVLPCISTVHSLRGTPSSALYVL